MVSDCLTVIDASKQIQTGALSAQDLITQTLDVIATREPTVQAWEYLNTTAALKQAIECDRHSPYALGPLQGIAIALKDIIATADMPTGWGTPVHQGAMPGYDAAIVERLRAAGAILIGKTVTTEYATARPGKTRNPHNPNHTPGGSSSGSAAAVAAGMVPVALGTQTLGSILRPAAYCGVLGFKPSFGSISRYGVMPVCRDLDHVGLFARTVPDLQLLCSVLAIPDERDPDCCGNLALQHGIPFDPTEASTDSIKLAAWKTPYWSLIEPETQQRFLDLIAQPLQGFTLHSIDLSPALSQCYEDAQTLMGVGLAVNHGSDYDQHSDQLSPKLQEWIERGRQTSAIAYGTVRQRTVEYSKTLAQVFREYDAILMPVTTGPAPDNLADTGSPILCAISTLCGLPAISIPAGTAKNGLPLAVQLMGPKFGDCKLLAIANRFHPFLQRAFPSNRSEGRQN